MAHSGFCKSCILCQHTKGLMFFSYSPVSPPLDVFGSERVYCKGGTAVCSMSKEEGQSATVRA